MSDVEVIIKLPETLFREVNALGIPSNEHIERLRRADIESLLRAMSEDEDIQRVIKQIEAEFASTESDGLDEK